MSALLLSLLVATAKSAYDARSNEPATQISADIVVLDRLFVHYWPGDKGGPCPVA